LKEVTLDEIESEMAVKARDVDLGVEAGIRIQNIGTPAVALILEEQIIHEKGVGSSILTKYPKRRQASFDKRRLTQRFRQV